MEWHALAIGKRGSQREFSNAAIQTRLTLNALSRMPLRQTTGFVGSLLRLTGLDGFVAQLGLSLDLPLAQTDSAYGDGTRYGKCCESI